MKQENDTKTLELPLKKRGRPVTGRALSAAERKREQKYRDEKLTIKGQLSELTISGLMREVQLCMRDGLTSILEEALKEVVKRAELNKEIRENKEQKTLENGVN
jgi:hypothetical protein